MLNIETAQYGALLRQNHNICHIKYSFNSTEQKLRLSNLNKNSTYLNIIFKNCNHTFPGFLPSDLR